MIAQLICVLRLIFEPIISEDVWNKCQEIKSEEYQHHLRIINTEKSKLLIYGLKNYAVLVVHLFRKTDGIKIKIVIGHMVINAIIN